MTDTRSETKFKTLSDLGEVVAAERKQARDNEKPLYEDKRIVKFGDNELVIRTFKEFGYDTGQRGVYLLKMPEQGLVRLGAMIHESRRGSQCTRLGKLAEKLSIEPLSHREAIGRAMSYLKSKGYQF